jgi:CHAT domain-containing protein/tetratricopeptide (TPR) repeat protein
MTPPDSPASPLSLMSQGDALLDAGRSEAAATCYARGLALAVAGHDDGTVSLLAGTLGNLALAAGRPAEALVFYEQAAAAYRVTGDLGWAAAMLTSAGNALQDLERLEEAAARHTEAENLAASVGARDWQGRAANNLGNVLAQQQAFERAATAHERALRIGEALEDAELTTMARRALGADLRNRAHQLEVLADLMEPAQDVAEQTKGRLEVLAAWRRTDDTGAQARCLARLVALCIAADRLDDAEAVGHEHVALAIRTGQAGQRTYGLGQLGQIALRRGRFAYALRLLTYQYELAREPGGGRDLEVEALDRLASAHVGLGRFNLAERCLMMLQALPESRDTTAALRAQRLDNYGLISRERGATDQAETCFRAALEGLPEDDASAEALTSRLHLADLLRERGDRERSIDQVAFVLDHSVDRPLIRAAACIALGRQAAAEGDTNTALSMFGQAAELAERFGDGPRLVQALTLLGTTRLSTGDPAGCEEAALRAVAAAEAQGLQLDDLSSVRLFAHQEAAFRLLQRVCLATGRQDDALVASERSRTRALLQVMVQRQAGGRRVRDDKAMLAKVAFDVVMNRSGQTQGTAIVGANEVRMALSRLALPNVEPEPRPLPSTEAMRATAAEHGATLIEYALVDADTAWIWVVDADAVHGRPVPPAAADEPPLAAQVEALLAALTDDSVPPERIDASLRTLHGRLIEPVADLLRPGALLCLVPDAVLFRLPFAALLDADDVPLAARHPLCHAPSIEVLGLSREAARRQVGQGQASPPLIVGAPAPVRLPDGFAATQTLPSLAYAAQEARDIAATLRADAPLLGADATLAAVLARLPTASLVHLAAHALLDDAVPSTSTVLLAAPDGGDGGALTVGLLQEQSLRASLVVLSACSTALGPVTGDGVAGFARALGVAGAPSVVVALWPLADATTWDLMVAFYERLVGRAETVAVALQQAMLEQRKATPHPRHWASMALYGQAGTTIAAAAPPRPGPVDRP